MASLTRIYIVTDANAKTPRLVRAATPAGAIRHVVADMFLARPASQDVLVAALQAGLIVEDCVTDPQALARLAPDNFERDQRLLAAAA